MGGGGSELGQHLDGEVGERYLRSCHVKDAAPNIVGEAEEHAHLGGGEWDSHGWLRGWRCQG